MSERFNWRAHLKVHPAADLFPLMSQDELKALAEDIKTNGLQQPIILWRESSTDAPVLDDGRNRLDALALLDWLGPPRERAPREPIKKYKRRVQSSPLSIGDDEDECRVIPERCFQIAGGDPYDLALSLNIQRRHLSAEQKRELIAKMLKAKPESSDRSIAEPLRVDHKTVGAVRHDLEDRGEIPHHDKRTDSTGRQQPAKKKPALADDNAESSAQARKDHYAADVAAEEDFDRKKPNPAEEELLERVAFWNEHGPRLWIEHHPGHTEEQFEQWGSCGSTDEEYAEWHRWHKEVWCPFQIKNGPDATQQFPGPASDRKFEDELCTALAAAEKAAKEIKKHELKGDQASFLLFTLRSHLEAIDKVANAIEKKYRAKIRQFQASVAERITP
jgi:hypothetical protein